MAPGLDLNPIRRLLDEESTARWLTVVVVALLTVTASAAPAYVVLADDDGQTAGDEDPATSARQGQAAGPKVKGSLPDSALLRALGLPADGELRDIGKLEQALSEVQATPENVPTSPGSILELAAQDAGIESAQIPAMQKSASLEAALTGLAHEVDKPGLTDEERAAIESLPDDLTRPLARLVDAMTLATYLQKQATENVSQEERKFLIDHAPELAAGTADEATVERAREIASRIDMSKSVAASRVLVSAVEDVRPQLAELAGDLHAKRIEELNQQHTAPQHEMPPREAIPTDPARDRVLRDTAELVRSRTPLTRAPTATPGVPLDRAISGLASAFGASTSVETLEAASNLPPELSKAIGRIVKAYTDTLSTPHTSTGTGPGAPTAAEGAASVLEAIEASRPPLERWSWILHQAPPITRPLTQARATDQALALASDSLDLGSSPAPVSDALRAAVSTTGRTVEAPDWLPEDGPPEPKVTMNAWYDAFQPNTDQPMRARAVEDLNALPDDVRNATLTMLWAQVEADKRAHKASDGAQKVSTLKGLDAAIVATVVGAKLDADASRTLRDHVKLVDGVARGLQHEPAQILADASDRALEILDERRTDPDRAQLPSSALPANHDPAPGPHPPSGDEAVDTVEETVEDAGDDSPVPDDGPDVGPEDPPEPGDVEEEIPDEGDVEDAIPDSDEDPVDDDTTPSPDPPPGATNPDRDIWFEDPTGRIIVTGFKATTLPAGRHASVHLDLGGDDTWSHNAGGAEAPQAKRYAVMLDLGGDDTYDTTNPFAQGGVHGETLSGPQGVLGTAAAGMLVDATGDDRYTGGPFSQGAVLGGGTGVLADLDGEDEYTVDGEWKPPGIAYDIAGGQGYAVSNLGDPATNYMGATALLAEAGGSDTYETPKGLGAGLSLFTDDVQASTRQANGLVFERVGEDEYDCPDDLLCLGQGRRGNAEKRFALENPALIELADGALLPVPESDRRCRDHQEGIPDDFFTPGGPYFCTSSINPAPGKNKKDTLAGIRVGLGVFSDTGGTDTYVPQEGWTERGRHDGSVTNQFARIKIIQADPDQTTDYEVALIARASVFLDLDIMGDGDGDRYPNNAENLLGYDRGDGDDNPHENLLDALNATGLVFASDEDRDCWNDALEQRMGTNEEDNASRPVDPPGADCQSPQNGYLLDLRLETTLGTGPTRTGGPQQDTNVAPTGVNFLQIQNGFGGYVGSDGRTVPLLALGDTTRTNYTEPYRIAMDLGGRDTYEAAVGAAAKPFGGNASEGARQGDEGGLAWKFSLPGIAMDVDGDDTYKAPDEDVAFGGGLPGAFGVLAELAGSDRYEADQGLGASFGTNAVGVLADLDGADLRQAGTSSAMGYSFPACTRESGAPSHVNQTTACTGSGPSVGLLIDARGSDATVGPRQGLLDNGELSSNVDLRRGVLTLPEDDPPFVPDTLHTAPSLAGYLDLQGADRYEIDDPDALDRPHKVQGYALLQAGFDDNDNPTEGRIRGGALFLDADSRDLYEVPARNLSLVDVSDEKNDLMLTRGIRGMEDGDESPSVFWDARGTTDLARNPTAFGQENLDTISGANRPNQDDRTVGRPVGTDPQGPMLQIPQLGVYVGGVGSDSFDDASRLAVDLGGDDTYTAPVGAGFGHIEDRERPSFDAGLALDLGGDDTYNTTVRRPRGGSTPPTADGVGPDPLDPSRGRFIAGTQGAGVLGTGVLIELGGSNEFHATVDTKALEQSSTGTVLGVAQGAGFYGVGLLYADVSQNAYTSRIDTSLAGSHLDAPRALGIIQGASVNGTGLLVSQAPAGHDSYVAKVVNATNQRHGIAQGATPFPGTPGEQAIPGGCGLCPDVPVGRSAAFLLDRGGDDLYQAAPTRNSQGANQGLLVDLGGRNTFNGEQRSSRDTRAAGLYGCTMPNTGAPTLPQDNRIVCPVQDNADRLVTILLHPGSVEQILSTENPAPGGPVALEASTHPVDSDGNCDTKGSLATIRERVCLQATIKDTAETFSGNFEVEDYTFWIEQGGRSPVLIDRVEPSGSEMSATTVWPVTLPDSTGAAVVDGEAQLRVVARIVPDSDAGMPGEDQPVFSLREKNPVTIDTPPRVKVTVERGDDVSGPWFNKTFLENGGKIFVELTVEGEAQNDKPITLKTLRLEDRDESALCDASGDSGHELAADIQLGDPPNDSGFGNKEVFTFEVQHNNGGPGVDPGPLPVRIIHPDGSESTATIEEGAFDLVANVTDGPGKTPSHTSGCSLFGYDNTAPAEGDVELLGQDGQSLSGMTQNVSTAGSGTFVVGWSVTDDVSGVTEEGVRLIADGPEEDSCGDPDRQANELGDDLPPAGNTTYGPARHGDTITFCVTVEDRAGNTATRIGETRTDIDLSTPTLSSPSVSHRFVQATNASQGGVVFSVNATEDGSLGRTEVLIDADAYELDQMGSHQLDEKRATYELAFDDWPEVVETLAEKYEVDDLGNLTRPEGYAYRFVVEDPAGNRASTNEATLVIDETDPLLLNTTVEYTGGTAAGPGDLVRLAMQAADNFGVERVTVNATGVSSAGEVRLAPTPGTGNYSAAFVLDGEVTPPTETVTLKAVDRAGNQVQRDVTLDVVTEAVTIEKTNVTNVTARNATVTWVTDKPSRGTVQLVNEVTSEATTREVNETAREHEMRFDGLDPSTPYTVTLVPANAAGDTAGSRRLNFTTGSLIEATITQPADDSLASGAARIAWNATTPRSGALTYTVSFVSEHGVVPAASTTGAPGDPASVTVSTRDLLDGVYQLQLEAVQGFDRTTVHVPGIRVDNTLPQARLTHPEPGGAAPVGEVTLEAFVLDEGSGVDPDTVRFRVDGQTIAPETIDNGTVTATHTFDEPGLHQVAIEAADAAGNEITDGGPVAASEDVPEIVHATLGGRGPLDASGDTSARVGNASASPAAGSPTVAFAPGDEVPIRARVSDLDLTGQLDARPIGVEDPIELDRSTDRMWGELEIPADATDGEHVLALEVTDDAGHLARVSLPLVVDGTSPTMQTVATDAPGPASAVVTIQADEPVTARAWFTPTDASRAGTVQTTHDVVSNEVSVVAEGLVPATEYKVEIEVSDAAGNTANASSSLATPEDQIPPDAVANARASVTPEGSVRLEWTPASDGVGLAGYDIFRVEQGGETTRLARVDETSYVDEDAPAGSRSTYRVVAVDRGENKAPDVAEVTVRPIAAPRLSNGQVTPEEGPPGTTFTYSVDYRGPVEPRPTVEVVINDVPRTMQGPENLSACRTGCTFTHQEQMPVITRDAGAHSYSFRAVLGGFVAQEPSGGEAHGPFVAHGASEEGALPASPAMIGIGGTVAAFVAGIAAAVWKWG